MERYNAGVDRMVRRVVGVRGPPRPDTGAPASGTAMRRLTAIAAHLPSYREQARDIPVFDTCDILVVGGGPAGLSAAIAARRADPKAKVILAERYGCFGGVITTVGMETLGWYRYEGTVEGNGIGMEMERIAASMGGSVKWPYNDSECLDADAFKHVADQLIRKSGVTPLLHCLVVEAIMDENSEKKCIRGVIFESKSGRQAIFADRVIDATGDADVAHLAGALYRKNDRKDMMGVTTVFGCSGVEKRKFLSYINNNPSTYKDWVDTWAQKTTGKEDRLKSPYIDHQLNKARDDGIIPKGMTGIGGSWSALTDAGEATNLNLVHMKGYDGTDVRDLTTAEMEGREKTQYAIKALQHCLPGFENAKLRTFGMTLGVRDTRKIIGRYNLTSEDVKEQARFTDSIGIFPEFIDGYNILILPTTGRYFQVPYGCMVPDVDNLLVAGRCVAGDNVSHAAMRNMMACTVTGQGAGVAAAVSRNVNQSTHSVDVRSIQKELAKQGVRVH